MQYINIIRTYKLFIISDNYEEVQHNKDTKRFPIPKYCESTSDISLLSIGFQHERFDNPLDESNLPDYENESEHLREDDYEISKSKSRREENNLDDSQENSTQFRATSTPSMRNVNTILILYIH